MRAHREEKAQVADLAAHRGRFFSILHQTALSQSGQMTVEPGQEAGPPETHQSDQVFLFLEGEALVRVWEPEQREFWAPPMTLVTIPAGTRHWVKSVGTTPLFFFTVYAPPAY